MEYNFQDNVSSSAFNSTSKNILNWIEDNREKFDWAKDPNAYEMTNLFLFGAKYSQQGEQIDTDTLTQMWNIRSKDFERCNIGPNNFVYVICNDAYQSSISGVPLVDDEDSHHALRKMAGLGLYLMQQHRDAGQISFNNPDELLQLLKCASSLKTLHPDLFNKYRFSNNIEMLCQLQLQHELPDEIENQITTLGAKLSDKNSRNKIAPEDDFLLE